MSSSAVLIDITTSGISTRAFVSPTLDGSAITFWRFNAVKHTPFAVEPFNYQATGGVPALGASSVKFRVPRNGDLVWSTWLKMTLPGIATNGGGDPEVSLATTVANSAMYVNGVAQAVLQRVKLNIGGQKIDELTFRAACFWEELSGQPGKRLGESIGFFETDAERRLASRYAQELYVPLQFSFSNHTGLALPIVSLQFHAVDIEVDFHGAATILDGNAAVTPATVLKANAGVVDPGAIAVADNFTTGLSNSDLTCEVESFLVYLDHDERSKFAMGSFEQVIQQFQLNDDTISGTGATGTNAELGQGQASKRIRLNLNHVVKEYIVGVRPALYYETGEDPEADVRNGAAVPTNNMDFRGLAADSAGMLFGEPASVLPKDPIATMRVLFNNQERVSEKSGKFFRLVTPWVVHTNLPDRFLYVWSYAVDPEDPNPSGGANHSRIDTVELDITLDGRNFGGVQGTAGIHVVAVSNNVIKYAHGLASLRFGS